MITKVGFCLKEEMKTLLIDLDETLIHAEDYNNETNYDFVIELQSCFEEDVMEVRRCSLKN